nr:retrotransposon protein, putative, Ty1-copia subclass [Tanacetum cinerariifolium]
MRVVKLLRCNPPHQAAPKRVVNQKDKGKGPISWTDDEDFIEVKKKKSGGNVDDEYHPYDDDTYEAKKIPNNIQTICDNLVIKMTTSSTNNSVFMGFFEKQKLTGPNFIDWYQQLRIVLSIKDNLNYLEQPIPPAPQAEQELLQTTRDFHSCRQEEGQSVSSYVLKMKGYIDNLDSLGHPVTLGFGGLRASRKLKPRALSLYVGNGQREAVEAIDTLFMNNMVYFSAIPKDGIFEIDLSNSLTNESSIYDMARKPYTHQVERAKDLLGLRHTDVCGPFKIMSRQGASYFVTFIDDFSRYGYVYLLKYKHEVFKTFKVFQKEVENQLGKTIKSLHSNRKDEYMSQEFLDHLKDHRIIDHRTPPYTPQHNENSLINQEVSGSLEDLEIIQEEDTYPSIDTSLNHEEDDLEIDKPQSDIVSICRSTRTRHAPDHMCLYIDAEEHELGNLGEPANYKATLLEPESEKWLNAMNLEMQSIKDNEVWVLVELPPHDKTVGSKWLFKKKTDMDGNVHTYKARLVGKGYTQTPRIDYEETFSPVAGTRAIRILIAIATYYDYEI